MAVPALSIHSHLRKSFASPCRVNCVAVVTNQVPPREREMCVLAQFSCVYE